MSKMYASGDIAWAECDRCGQTYPYTDIEEEWDGLRVCPICFDEKHPQLDPVSPGADAEALKHPNPARTEPQYVYVGERFPMPGELQHIHAAGSVGNASVSIS